MKTHFLKLGFLLSLTLITHSPLHSAAAAGGAGRMDTVFVTEDSECIICMEGFEEDTLAVIPTRCSCTQVKPIHKACAVTLTKCPTCSQSCTWDRRRVSLAGDTTSPNQAIFSELIAVIDSCNFDAIKALVSSNSAERLNNIWHELKGSHEIPPKKSIAEYWLEKNEEKESFNWDQQDYLADKFPKQTLVTLTAFSLAAQLKQHLDSKNFDNIRNFIALILPNIANLQQCPELQRCRTDILNDTMAFPDGLKIYTDTHFRNEDKNSMAIKSLINRTHAYLDTKRLLVQLTDALASNDQRLLNNFITLHGTEVPNIWIIGLKINRELVIDGEYPNQDYPDLDAYKSAVNAGYGMSQFAQECGNKDASIAIMTAYPQFFAGRPSATARSTAIPPAVEQEIDANKVRAQWNALIAGDSAITTFDQMLRQLEEVGVPISDLRKDRDPIALEIPAHAAVADQMIVGGSAGGAAAMPLPTAAMPVATAAPKTSPLEIGDLLSRVSPLTPEKIIRGCQFPEVALSILRTAMTRDMRETTPLAIIQEFFNRRGVFGEKIPLAQYMLLKHAIKSTDQATLPLLTQLLTDEKTACIEAWNWGLANDTEISSYASEPNTSQAMVQFLNIYKQHHARGTPERKQFTDKEDLIYTALYS